MEGTQPPSFEAHVPSAAELTLDERTLLEMVKSFEFGFVNPATLADTLGESIETVEEELEKLVEKDCIAVLRGREGKPASWYLKITNTTELEHLKEINNPKRFTAGHFTGRCGSCESDNLWSDDSIYGCNCCGAEYGTADIAPRKIENGTGRDLGPAWF